MDVEAHQKPSHPVAHSLTHAIACGESWSPEYHARWPAPEAVDTAAAQPSIAAAELARVLMSVSVDQAPRGILLTGLRVVGLLDLEQFCFALPLALRDCTVSEGIRLDRAILGALDLSGSRFPFLTARSARVSGDLVLQGLMETDWIDLGEARIAGHLKLARTDTGYPAMRARPGRQ